ncbi:MAG: Glu-tRNA(Gln) amidotransferase subunit GatD [Candidatus Pacearchaeota archaeon]
MKEKISPGDEVKIFLKNDQILEGIVMPCQEKDFLLIKLRNGYNIGISKKEIKNIEKIGKQKLEKFPETKIESKVNKTIVVIIAGGTISSRVDYTTGAVSSLMKPENLFFLVPKLGEIANIKIDFAFSILSENITPKHWKILVEKCEKWMNDDSIDGIIITHGTDTLHYTSAALSFMLKNINKPIVLTYAQRSSDRPSTDAILNLIASSYVALSDIAEVLVVGHGSIDDDYCYVLRGTKVRKMHSTRRDTFRPINCLPIAKVWGDGKIEFISDYKKKQEVKEKPKADFAFNEKVALIKFYPNADSSILDFYYKKGYKGIVIEATGMGHVSNEGKNNWLKKIRKLSKKMLICFAPQTIYGSLNQYVYSTARELTAANVLYLKDILPETAYVKLGYVLGKTRDLKKAREMMLMNIANEFSDREIPESFLF